MNCMSAAAALALALLLTLSLVSGANAKTVWRCGDDGRTYSESPCPGGRTVNAADTRTAAQTSAAREEIKRSQDLAARMRKERLEDETRNRNANALAGSLGPNKSAAKAPEKPKSKAKPKRRPGQAHAADDGTWQATAPGSRRKKD